MPICRLRERMPEEFELVCPPDELRAGHAPRHVPDYSERHQAGREVGGRRTGAAGRLSMRRPRHTIASAANRVERLTFGAVRRAERAARDRAPSARIASRWLLMMIWLE